MITPSEQTLFKLFNTAGYNKFERITDTLQGSIWRSYRVSSDENVVIKVTNRDLHSKSMIIINSSKHKVRENIFQEKNILKYLTKQCKKCPNSIVKYVNFLKSNVNYYLIMEDGGSSLFDFVVKAHDMISRGYLSIKAWQKTVKVIFKQMIECIEYIHGQNVAHFDISLENFVIKGNLSRHGQMQQIKINNDSIQIKLVDFGVAEKFCGQNNPQFSCRKFCGKSNYFSPEVSQKKNAFSARKNDIWCLGVCFFMMVIGNAPFIKSRGSDKAFSLIMNGELKHLLNLLDKSKYVNNKHLMPLFLSFFQFEANRVSIQEIKKCKWLN